MFLGLLFFLFPVQLSTIVMIIQLIWWWCQNFALVFGDFCGTEPRFCAAANLMKAFFALTPLEIVAQGNNVIQIPQYKRALAMLRGKKGKFLTGLTAGLAAAIVSESQGWVLSRLKAVVPVGRY